jgi:protein phosphatase/serine/threonine-protein phosphatase Stp1
MTASQVAASLRAAGRFRSSAATHEGAIRAHNEDAYVNRPDLGLWAVADGAGGHQAGDVASRILAEALDAVPRGLGAAELLAEVRLRLGRAHGQLLEEAVRRGPNAVVASTIVVLLAREDNYACLWAGDSRAYLLRAGSFRQVNHDHSLVQQLVDAGVITPAQALVHPNANIITRAVGADGADFELDKVTGRLRSGDRLLLCSDGLSKTVPEHGLAALLAAEDTDAEPFLAAALERHADDNVTAVTVEVLAEPSRDATSTIRKAI